MSVAAPMIAHVIHRLAIGGLENGLANLINAFPPERYRHAIVCMTDFDPDFRARIRSAAVPVFEIGKRPGQDPGARWRVWQLLRVLRPAIVHTRNLAALDALVPAALAGARVRIHGEHGWDADDPGGTSRKRIWLRRLHRPLVHHYIAVSGDLERYLVAPVGVPAANVTRICNGVDTERFRAARGAHERLATLRFGDERLIVIGTVGRLDAVKGQSGLVEAFHRILASDPALAARLRLAIVGDGPLRSGLEEQIRRLGLEEQCWLPGARADVPELLRGFDLFVLPSLAEGISNTVLEAMASGLPVVATAVGGNSELVEDGITGALVPPGMPDALAAAARRYAASADLRRAHGEAGRARACRQFSLATMVAGYTEVYDRLLRQRQSHRR